MGNLSFSTTEIAIRDAFSAFGTVDSVSLINDRNSGRPKGFGFIEMNNDQEAKAAIAGLDGKSLDDRDLRVNEARPKEDRPARGGFGGRRSGYRG